MFKIELSDITLSGLKSQLEHHLTMIKAYATSAIEQELVKETPVSETAAPAKGKRGPKPKTLAETESYPQPPVEEGPKTTLFKQLAEKRDAAFKTAEQPETTVGAVAQQATPSISYKQVSDATLEAIKSHGRDKVVGIINSEFKAPSARDLKPDQYASFLERLSTLGADDGNDLV